jgi:hypothetical protein
MSNLSQNYRFTGVAQVFLPSKWDMFEVHEEQL